MPGQDIIFQEFAKRFSLLDLALHTIAAAADPCHGMAIKY